MTFDKLKLTAKQILAMSENSPEKLFSVDLDIAKSEFHALSRIWHPDHNKASEATAVFQRVTELYRKAQELIKANRWRGAGILELSSEISRNGFVDRRIPYFKIVDFELGDMYLGESNVVFSVERQYADLFETPKNKSLNFASPTIRCARKSSAVCLASRNISRRRLVF